MQAFHNDETIKLKYLARIKAHALADEIVKGQYWEDGKGCAVGCTIHGSEHDKYEIELGIPSWLAKVEDRIFEGLPNERAKIWPEQFLEAINVGANLETVRAPFLVYILKSTLDKFDHRKYPKVLKTIQDVIHLYEIRETDIDKLKQARDAAAAAAVAYADASTYAAAAAANVAADAVAYDDADVAAASTYAADAAAYAAYADADARQIAYVKFADELLRLLRECI